MPPKAKPAAKKSVATGKLTQTETELKTGDIDWSVFGLDLDPSNSVRAGQPVPPPSVGPPAGLNGLARPAGGNSYPPPPRKPAAGVKLASLNGSSSSGPSAPSFDTMDLSHLRSTMKRAPGYTDGLPPLQSLLEERGVDYMHPSIDKDVQLPLEAFEDKTMCTRTPEEWQLKASAENLPLACKFLKLQDDGTGRWLQGAVANWDAEQERYLVKSQGGAEDRVLSLHVFFVGDDPVLFADRLAKAIQSRRYANSLLKYNFFIDSMPEDRSRRIGRESTVKISSKAKAGIWDANSPFAEKLDKKLESLVEEAQKEFVRVQNQITFDKVHLQGAFSSLPLDLQLPPPVLAPEVPYLAVKTLPSYDPTAGTPDLQVPRGFGQAYEWFCGCSLLIRSEVVGALQETRFMCLDLSQERVFETGFATAVRTPEFVERQDAAIYRLKGRLGMWVNTIRMRITQRLQQATEKWYQLNETSIDKYRASRLRLLLVTARLMMSNSFLLLAEDALNGYVDFICNFVPMRLEIPEGKPWNAVDLKDGCGSAVPLKRVHNIMMDLKSGSGEKVVEPLFKSTLFKFDVNILDIPEPEAPKEDKKKKKDEPPPPPPPPAAAFGFNVSPEACKQSILETFDNGIRVFADVHSVESVLLPHLIRDDHLDPNFTPQSAWVVKLRERVAEACDRQVPWLNNFLKKLEEFRDVVLLDPDAAVTKFKAEGPPPKDVRKMIEERQLRCKQVLEGIPDAKETTPIGFYLLDTGAIRTQLCEKLDIAVQKLLSFLANQLDDDIQTATGAFSDMFTKLKTELPDIESCGEMKDYIKQLPGDLQKLQGGINEAMQLTELVEDLRYVLPTETLDARWRMFASPGDVKREMLRVEEIMDKASRDYAAKQDQEQKDFDQRLLDLDVVIESFSEYQSLDQVQEVAAKVKQTNQEIKECQDLVRLFNAREVLFDRDQTDYSNLGTMVKAFEPYANLWKTAGDWKNNKEAWLHGNFQEIDPRYCENEVTGGIRLLFKTIRALKSDENKADEMKVICSIAELIKTELEEFKPNLPLVVGLRNEGMRERHWQQLSEIAKAEVGPDMEGGLSLDGLLKMGLLNQVPEVEKIGDRAGKEFTLEKTLNRMKADWEPLIFDLSEKYRKTNTYILKGEGEAMAALDEHIVTTQAMMFSMFKGPFEEEIDEWNSRLLRVSETLDEWLKCQRAWMYLQPIFDSDDIMRQLPTEGKRFKHVDSTWRSQMNNAKDNPKIIDVCASEGLLETWRDCNIILDTVQKGLEDYLETKRNGFARFYFLSNDELLEILSQAKDPTRVQPFLSKVFEAMNKVTFNADNDILNMISPEGEVIPLVEPCVTHQKAVEVWMCELENCQNKAIRGAMEKGIHSYLDGDRPMWVLDNPAQIVLNGSQVHWTAEVEAVFTKQSVQEVAEYAKRLDQQMIELVKLFSPKPGEKGLSKMQRTTVGALVVIDVHAKEILHSFAADGIIDVSSFEWISQLRYYWEHDERGQENLWVKCVQTSFPYGYEYLGNSMRLVITPLTDVCYITLMGAQALSLGGAPAGPAGTGKTETTKDLAKALAKQCVVFNCSPEMDYIMVGKFFKGLALSGAWCCFDEFNRINIEVLSVIAQQLLVLFGKKSELKSYNDTVELEFEGTLIVMRPTFNVFITMNPGYAGRAELPDNLAALFRPVAMMVPDYALIGEIMFYAYGFEVARTLSKKMVTTFTLSSEQLSSQCHYDYGMRAVKSTIEMCGKLKREVGDSYQEDQITLRALRDVNVPKFLKDDLPLFENIISDLFPDTERPHVEYGALVPALELKMKEMQFILTENFQTKVVQLIDTIGVRHGLMLVGPNGGGKTTNFRVLQVTSGYLKETGDKKYENVITHILNPKSITQAQLYGAFDEVTREWSDGVASECVRNAVAIGKGGSPDANWVIFDGPVDALWIESMNTVLDDNKKLCLTSGEIIALTPQMRMIFEVEDLSVASPATVSRCGMVYMEPSALGNEPLIDSWLMKLPPTFTPAFAPLLRDLMVKFSLPMIRVVRKKTREYSGTVDNNLVQSHFRLLDCYFSGYFPTEAKTASADEVAQLFNILTPLFFFTLVWSVGATCDNKGRVTFSAALWDEIKSNGQSIGGSPEIPADAFWYDYCFVGPGEDDRVGQWLKWLEFAPKYSVPARSLYQNIVVPTVDSIRLTHAFSTLIVQEKHVIIAGETGTGKSSYISLWLQKGAPESIQSLFINFSAQTGVNQVQDLLDSKFEKRRRGVFGPPAGKKCVIFIDDLNMPKKEYYGAQPPIELIRQWMDYKGWYNRKELKCNEIIDIIHVSAMGPPGGGKTEISGRLRRHYNTLAAADMSRDSIANIFQTILEYFLIQGYDDSVKKLKQPIVDCCIKIFESCCEELLPTPSKSHYQFNLRDIWKVFQGVCSLNSKKVNDPISFMRCYCHENLRVYADRLTCNPDREWMRKQLDESLINTFNTKPENIFDKPRLIFGDFLPSSGDTKFYMEIEDLNQMKTIMENFLDDYNNCNAVQMPLVMFTDACEHVARVCRVLRQPSGNVLLLGVGGSGRQSLSRLASFMSEFDVFQIEVIKGYGMNEFKDDLKTCLMRCGNELKVQVFLFTDTQIVNEQMVEAINSVLNSGDVPNLYKPEDTDVIMQACRAACQQDGIPPTKQNVFTAYIKRVKAYIHVVLAFSPVGDAFRTRLRMFPSLVNCCTLDWFAEWPAEALYGVGKQLMTIEDMQLPNLEGCLVLFRTIHQSVEKSAGLVLQRVKRAIYITPTSFLEQISAFKKILGIRRNAVGTLKKRLEGGLSALGSAEYAVANMEIELKAKEPVLAETKIKVAEMMVVITEDKKKAAVTKEEASKVSVEAEEQAASATAIKTDAQRDLDEALPALEVANKALKALKLSSLQEIKVLQKPPGGVKLTLEAVCILFAVKPIKKNDPDNPGKKIDDYWEASQKGPLSDPKKTSG
jgi:dynein heavy chain